MALQKKFTVFKFVLQVLVLVVVLSTSGLGFGFKTTFKKEKIKVGKHELLVEIADTEDRQRQGLMYRDARSLDENAGMLFIFDQEKPQNFWMKNTFIPLSIAFFDKNKKLIDIQDMRPSRSEMEMNPDSVQSKGNAMYALEVNQGWFVRHAISVKDEIRWDWAKTPSKSKN